MNVQPDFPRVSTTFFAPEMVDQDSPVDRTTESWSTFTNYRYSINKINITTFRIKVYTLLLQEAQVELRLGLEQRNAYVSRHKELKIKVIALRLSNYSS